MQQRFMSGTEEYELFNDFWKLCQMVWVPEDNDGYWKYLHDSCKTFGDAHGEFGRMLAMTLMSYMDKKYRGGGAQNGNYGL